MFGEAMYVLCGALWGRVLWRVGEEQTETEGRDRKKEGRKTENEG